MKISKLLKMIVLMVVCLGVIVLNANFAFATDEGDPFTDLTHANTTNSAENQVENNTATNDIYNNLANATNTPSLTNSVQNASTNNATTNRSVSNTNSLAKTGIADFNGGLAIFVIISIISAIYSYKKVNDYKKI